MPHSCFTNLHPNMRHRKLRNKNNRKRGQGKESRSLLNENILRAPYACRTNCEQRNDLLYIKRQQCILRISARHRMITLNENYQPIFTTAFTFSVHLSVIKNVNERMPYLNNIGLNINRTYFFLRVQTFS